MKECPINPSGSHMWLRLADGGRLCYYCDYKVTNNLWDFWVGLLLTFLVGICIWQA